jgi:hypothetical protein
LCFRLGHTEEEKLVEAEGHNILRNVSVAHQAQTEERRMEIVKVNRFFFEYSIQGI